MRVVVTGGLGRIGRVTASALHDAGHHVVVADRSPDDAARAAADMEFVHLEMDNYEAVARAFAGADAVVHLAGIPGPRPQKPQVVHNNNVVANYNALCAAAEIGIRRVVLASSVNAIGLTWSREPTFDYFPVDEQHPTRNEDSYSLSKWAGEQQADSIVRLHPEISVASFRIHAFLADREEALRISSGPGWEQARRGLWGYTTHRMWSDACSRALTADFTQHRRFFVVAARTATTKSSSNLASKYFPDVPLRWPLTGHDSFFDCTAAKETLGWSNDDD